MRCKAPSGNKMLAEQSITIKIYPTNCLFSKWSFIDVYDNTDDKATHRLHIVIFKYLEKIGVQQGKFTKHNHTTYSK